MTRRSGACGDALSSLRTRSRARARTPRGARHRVQAWNRRPPALPAHRLRRRRRPRRWSARRTAGASKTFTVKSLPSYIKLPDLRACLPRQRTTTARALPALKRAMRRPTAGHPGPPGLRCLRAWRQTTAWPHPGPGRRSGGHGGMTRATGLRFKLHRTAFRF